MAAPINWTKEQDEAILALVPGDRTRTFGALAQQWGFARWTVRERAKRLGIDVTAFVVPPQTRSTLDSDGNRIKPPSEVARETGRDPLPAGDPISWGALVEGTCLHGVEYQR